MPTAEPTNIGESYGNIVRAKLVAAATLQPNTPGEEEPPANSAPSAQDVGAEASEDGSAIVTLRGSDA